jgi:hypothetical protein
VYERRLVFYNCFYYFVKHNPYFSKHKIRYDQRFAIYALTQILLRGPPPHEHTVVRRVFYAFVRWFYKRARPYRSRAQIGHKHGKGDPVFALNLAQGCGWV